MKNQTEYGALSVLLGNADLILKNSQIEKAELFVSWQEEETTKNSSRIVIKQTRKKVFNIQKYPHNTPVLFEKIPEGPYKIVTFSFFSKDVKSAPLFELKATANINKNQTAHITVSPSTTAFANVLDGIKQIFNFNELAADDRMDTIKKVIDSDISPFLYNSSKLIGELQGFSFPYSATKDDYLLTTSTICFDYFLQDSFSVYINDPLSSPSENLKPSCKNILSGIAPGTWTLTVKDKNGKTVEKTEIQAKSGQCTKLNHLEHDGIAILVPAKEHKDHEFNFIHFWDVKYDKSDATKDSVSQTIWPGFQITQKITVKESEKNSSEYYLYNLPHAFFAGLLITDGNNENTQKLCEQNMFANTKGVYIATQEGLSSVCGLRDNAPSIQNLVITDENLKKCFIDDYENKRFVVLFSEVLYGKTPSSVKILLNKGINDLFGEYNGDTLNLVRDERGFWYTSVPYEQIQQTNQCGQPSYNFKIDNQLIEPPKYVPDGYIYQKFNETLKGKRFLVLIYSSQNEKIITSRLLNSKKIKHLKDFDLKTENGIKQLTNFRLTPGTRNLYRSFHPFCDDKKTLSNTSFERMQKLEYLCNKYKISADINLSDKALKTPTYKIPDFYKKIIDAGNILYMTDCSYSECYEKTNSSKFANGIKQIVQFVNNTQGPYLIHCAIGTDRTGIVCAVIAAMCGASIKEIEEDYCSSINMGILEYRGPGAVRYSLNKLLNIPFSKDIAELTDLQDKVCSYFINEGYLTKQEIDLFIQKI